jgi:biopolymer transport protein ExbD
MASRFHRLRARHAEREPLTAHGRINLVPLVDILTAIVFFSLLTYTGAVMTNLTAFDLALPPVVVTPEAAKQSGITPDTLTVLLAVGIKPIGLRVEGTGGGGPPFAQEIAGLSDSSMTQLRAMLTDIKKQYPNTDQIMVVPDDDVSYDDIVHVLEQVKFANLRKISLSSTARSMNLSNVSAPGAR